jgi:hypothetical protein
MSFFSERYLILHLSHKKLLFIREQNAIVGDENENNYST